jgi:energy-coupling factor transporter ATP-binding protein EcfA2
MSENIPLWWLVVVVIAFAFMMLGFIFYLRKQNKRQIDLKDELSEAESTREFVQTDKLVVREVNIPIAVAKLKLHNIRSFSTLDLGFATPTDSRAGQWTVILGDNGVGKSTILRGLVLALAHPDIATAVLQTQRSPAPFIRRTQKLGTIELTINGQLQYEVQLQLSARSRSEKLEVKKAAEERPALLAYGPLRGSALGGAARRVSFSAIDQVATLFDESAQLIHAETWLGQAQLAALQTRGGADEAFFDSVIKTLVKLLPGVDSIKVTSTGVELTGPEVGKDVPLAAMSDGYVGTLGWVLDFMARWCYRYQQLTGKPPDGEIAKQMSGLVVVDEIGLHLHPRWQTTVVQELRTQFPKMSFIVTSHHPLLLLGAREGEIHVLRRHPETREITIEQANIPPGTTADQILTGRWFNLSSTLDEDTKHLLEEHRSLLRAGKGEEDPLVQDLEDRLRGRLGTFADTSIDRMALSVASDVMKGKESSFDKLSQTEKEKIREEMEQELRSRIERMS